MTGGPVMLVDAYNLFVRNFVANPLMVEGQHVGGTVGFLQSLGSLVATHRPSALVVIWEGGGSSRRRAIFPQYKNDRRPQRLNRFHEGDIPDTVENRNWQVKLLVSLLQNLPIKQVYVSDCEADDVIGYMSRYHFKDRNILIVSSDHDYLQLVDDRVQVWSPTLKSIVDHDFVKKKFGVPPHNLCVTRCFTGDASDALPGIPGVGLKTMVNMFPRLAGDEELTVDDIIEMCDAHPKLDRIKALQAIKENREVARRNWKLMSLDVSNLSGNHVQKLNSSFEIPLPKPDKMNLIRQMVKNGIKTFDIDRFYLTITLNLRNE